MKSERVKKSATKTKRTVKAGTSQPSPALRVPPILLEGDTPAPAIAGGPGQRYALGPAPAVAQAPAGAGQELPEAYGTQKLLLTARDPHWLYAHWDLTREQLRHYNAQSADRHLVLRIYKNSLEGQPCAEVHVHPESRNWFVNVAEAGTQYLAELGYYPPSGPWVSISTSGATLTPPDNLSEDTSAWFETLPAEMQLGQLVHLVKSAVSEHVPLMEALQQLRAAGYRGLPDGQNISAGRWTPEQERALAELISMDTLRRIWMGSLEITEVIRRQLHQELFSAAAAQFGAPVGWSGIVGAVPGSMASVSSPYGVPERRKGFWFNVNAELIIYGATERDAEVTIGGRMIKLRPDGSFSYRFALPDGKYDLPAIATSADGTDSRSAALTFSRQTEYRGEVGKHPQDTRLKSPKPEHLE